MKKLSLEKVIFYTVFISTLFVLTYNFFHYSPKLGYDAPAHFSYVDYFSKYLPDSIKLPSDSDSREFFNPPVAYIFPSLVQVICRNVIDSNNFLSDCQSVYGNFTMILQAIIYLLTIFINLKSIQKLLNFDSYQVTMYFLLVSMLAVNYRTISMIRGEPYILFFLSLLIYFLIDTHTLNFKVERKVYLIVGLLIALIALSRQWGFLLFPAFGILFFHPSINRSRNYFKFLLFSFSIGFVLSSWFYFSLYFEYGTFTAFNKDSLGFNFLNKPSTFYLPNTEHFVYLFTNPIRPYLNNQFVTSLYADVWGDYWGYFSFTSQYLDIGRNQHEIGSYFANVNKLSVFTTTVAITCFFLANRKFKNHFVIKYISFSVLFSLLGYLWFTISYPEPAGDTVKATYIIQMFHLIIFSSSLYLESIKKEKPQLYKSVLVLLFSIYVYNFQTYLSHFPSDFVSSL